MLCFTIVASFVLETQTFLPFQVKIAHREQVELLVELDDISEVK